jgi:hypothetical protein
MGQVNWIRELVQAHRGDLEVAMMKLSVQLHFAVTSMFTAL